MFHITVHPGEFRARPDPPFAVIQAWLEQIVAPLIHDGRARWATFSQMADAPIAQERAQPNDPPVPPARFARAPQAAATNSPRAFVTFVVNAHGWVLVGRSADTIGRRPAIFQWHHARGDFHLTAPLVERHLERGFDTIHRLCESGMTINHRVRPPLARI